MGIFLTHTVHYMNLGAAKILPIASNLHCDNNSNKKAMHRRRMGYDLDRRVTDSAVGEWRIFL